MVGIEKIMAHVANATLKCKFEASDGVTDEITLLRLLQLLVTSVESPAGFYLTDSMINSMFDTCFSICFQVRLSELLRRASEDSILNIVRVLLRRTLGGLEETTVQNQASHGAGSLETFLNRLIDLLNPADFTGTQHIRLVSLRIICVTLETGSELLKRLHLIPRVLEDQFCRYLFNVRLY